MPIVSLNVGGKIFCTTQSTLDSEFSMLRSLVNNSNPAQLLDGSLFIDRDFTVFHYVLNFLRGSTILPQKNSTEFKLLVEESNYYCIDRLQRQLYHMSTPKFKKYDLVIAKGTKCTIIDVDDCGYIASKNKQKFRINSDEKISATTIEESDHLIIYKECTWLHTTCIKVISPDIFLVKLPNGEQLQVHKRQNNCIRF